MRMAVLVLLTALAACGGGEAVAPEDVQDQAFDDFRAQVESLIDDPSRRNSILAQVTELEAQFRAFRSAAEIRRKEMHRLHLDYDATQQQFDALLREHEAHARLARQAASDAHVALIASTTDDEWALLGRAHTRAVKNLIALLQAT